MSLKERIEADTAIAVANALQFERHRQQTLETVKQFFLERPFLFGSCHLSQYLPEELQVLNPLPARWEKELANFDEDVDILLVSLQKRARLWRDFLVREPTHPLVDMALEVQSLIRQKTFLLRQVAAQTTELECLRRKDYFDTQMTCQIIPKIQGLLSIYFKVRLPTALTLPDFYKQVTDF